MLVTDAPFSSARLDDYVGLVGADVVAPLRERAASLRGARVLHVNATAIGGGVAEILLSLVPLMRDAGLDTDWYVLEANGPFFEVTKRYHNALQGRPTDWSPEQFDVYWQCVERNARKLEPVLRTYDFVVVHDPQPLVLASHVQTVDGPAWLWRCHIDLTSPSPETWNALSPHLAQYDQLIFSSEAYVPEGLEAERIEIAHPCIDPFRAKNRAIESWEQREALDRYGIDAARPYLLQVSRFDPWKDPLGVLALYRRVRERHPGLQLVYMAGMADDDPEGWQLYQETKAAVGDDPDVHLLALQVPAWAVNRNALEVNAMQRGAAVVLQKSLSEGFGLAVTEALWKEKPVVAGNVGGLKLQVRDGYNGYLVSSEAEAAERVLELMNDPDRCRLFGERGREIVTARFLFTRLLGQYLSWFDRLS